MELESGKFLLGCKSDIEFYPFNNVPKIYDVNFLPSSCTCA